MKNQRARTMKGCSVQVRRRDGWI